jgi:hypothetical protein
MTRKGISMTAIIDADSQLLGVFTDGDHAAQSAATTSTCTTPVLVDDCQPKIADKLAIRRRD